MSTSRGALMDLVAKGVQDLPMIGNPQMTYFKQVYKRHTNFTRNSIQVSLDGGTSFGTKLTCKIPRSGDLLYNLILELDFPELTASGSDGQHYIQYIPNVGFAAIDYVEFKINGQRIDKQYGEWMYIWSQLSNSYDKRTTYDYMTKSTAQNGPFTAYIPLQFWFCRNYGSALPLVALQYHEVELDIQLKPLSSLYYFGNRNYYDLTYVGPSGGNHQYEKTKGLAFITSIVGKDLVYKELDGSTASATIISRVDNTNIVVDTLLPSTGLTESYIKPVYTITNPSVEYSDIRLYSDFIFLDTYEQKYFAKNDHRYLIEQIQFSEDENIGAGETSKSMKLRFNLPIKELIWVKHIDANLDNNLLLNFESTPDQYYEVATDDISTFTIKYNNEDRINERNGEYFRLLQPLQHHTNVPRDKYIYLYSYALYPENIEPSGSSNFSKIDRVLLNFKFRASQRAGIMRAYGLTNNVLRIENGMGGIAFAN